MGIKKKADWSLTDDYFQSLWKQGRIKLDLESDFRFNNQDFALYNTFRLLGGIF